MTKQIHQDRSPAASVPLAAAPWINSSAFDAMTRMGEGCAQVCQAWQQEVARFTASRLESDGELGRKLMTCGNWAEAARLQQYWASAMAQDYLNQANRMVQLASRMGAQMMAPEAATARSAGSERHTEAAE